MRPVSYFKSLFVRSKIGRGAANILVCGRFVWNLISIRELFLTVLLDNHFGKFGATWKYGQQMRKSELKAHFKTVCSGSRRSIAVQQFVNADVKQIGKLSKHRDVRLRASLLPVCVTAFYHVQLARNLFLCHKAAVSVIFETFAKFFIHRKFMSQTTQNVLMLDNSSSIILKKQR